MKYSQCLSDPLPFNGIQIVNPFPNSRTLVNNDKVKRLSANSESPYKGDCSSIVKSLLFKWSLYSVHCTVDIAQCASLLLTELQFFKFRKSGNTHLLNFARPANKLIWWNTILYVVTGNGCKYSINWNGLILSGIKILIFQVYKSISCSPI